MRSKRAPSGQDEGGVLSSRKTGRYRESNLGWGRHLGTCSFLCAGPGSRASGSFSRNGLESPTRVRHCSWMVPDPAPGSSTVPSLLDRSAPLHSPALPKLPAPPPTGFRLPEHLPGPFPVLTHWHPLPPLAHTLSNLLDRKGEVTFAVTCGAAAPGAGSSGPTRAQNPLSPVPDYQLPPPWFQLPQAPGRVHYREGAGWSLQAPLLPTLHALGYSLQRHGNGREEEAGKEWSCLCTRHSQGPCDVP